VADRESVFAEIETAWGPISVWEFSNFLYLFRAAYAAASDLLRQSEWPLLATDGPELEGFLVALRHRLPTYGPREIVHLASKPLPEELTILDLSRRNPVHIEFGGLATALVAAVILSGGSLKLGPIRAKLPPIGTGIAALREAFGRKPTRRGKGSRGVQ